MTLAKHRLSERLLNRKMMHNGVEMTVGLCIQLAENSGSDTEMQPYLVSLMFFAMGTKSQELLRECQRLKTIHGGAPLMLPATSNGSDMPDVDEDQESFVDRVKDIITKAAEKNNKEITSNARGRAYTYHYYINKEKFCNAMDKFAVDKPEMLEKYLGDTLHNVNVGVVAKFIGRVIDMEIINNNLLQRVDILFAFKDYYPNATTVKNKLSDKQLSQDDKLLFGTFEGYLKTAKP